jgi:putative membrane protein
MKIGLFGRLLITTLTILAIPYLIPGVSVEGVGTAIVAALLLAFLNVTLKPLLILITLPLTVLSLGLFLFVINAIVFLAIAKLLPGISINTFMDALGASLIVSVVSWFTHLSVGNQNGRRVVVIQQGNSQRTVRDLN